MVLAGWGPDSGGEWAELSQHPARRSGQVAQVIPAPHPDGEGCREAAPCPNHCGQDQVDCQFPDRGPRHELNRVWLPCSLALSPRTPGPFLKASNSPSHLFATHHALTFEDCADSQSLRSQPRGPFRLPGRTSSTSLVPSWPWFPLES